jgi:hypothetical protein
MSRTEPISLRIRFIDTSKAEMILLFFRALFRYPVFKVQVRLDASIVRRYFCWQLTFNLRLTIAVATIRKSFIALSKLNLSVRNGVAILPK